jgi:hypothetical protein
MMISSNGIVVNKNQTKNLNRCIENLLAKAYEMKKDSKIDLMAAAESSEFTELLRCLSGDPEVDWSSLNISDEYTEFLQVLFD